MNLTLLILIGGASLTFLALAAWMLHRAWGDFPGRLALPDQTPPPVRSWSATAELVDAVSPEPSLPAGAPVEELLPLNHPIVQQAIIRAMERGGSPYAHYFVREDDQVYLALYRIADPDERARIVQVVEALDRGETNEVSVYDMIEVMRRLARQ